MVPALREFLIKECESRNVSWRQASLDAGLDHNAISRYVNSTRPTRESCRKLAAYFDVPESEILALAGHVLAPQDFTPQTEVEWRLLERFRELSEEDQLYVLAQLDFIERYNGAPLRPRIIGSETEEERAEASK